MNLNFQTSSFFFSMFKYCHSLVNNVEDRPWWPIQSPKKGRKKKLKGQEGREIRASLYIYILDRRQDSVKEEEDKPFYKLHVL